MGASDQSRTPNTEHPSRGGAGDQQRSCAGGRGQRQQGKEETDAPLRIGQLVTDERQQQEQQRLLHEGGAGLSGASEVAEEAVVTTASGMGTPPRLLRADGRAIEAFVPASV